MSKSFNLMTMRFQFLSNRKIKVSFWERFIIESEMPPLLRIGLEVVFNHDILEKEAISALL
jgi:hypothetical protein